MKLRKCIGLDFDDVLVNFNGGLAVFHNEKYGTSYTREEITSFNYFQKTWGVDPTEALRRMREFVHSDHHHRLSPILGAIDAVKYLKGKGHKLHMITARDEVIRGPTHSLAEMHFGPSFDGFHFLHRDDTNVLGTKGDVCRKLEIDIMVEDSLENAVHIGEAGTRALLFDTPWNQTRILPKNVTRVFSWKEALEEIDR
jgi:uncharacterized HAD superfamily protein